jgi:hypothetical protein
VKSLYDALHSEETLKTQENSPGDSLLAAPEALTGEQFAMAVLSSREFRQYIVDKLLDRSIPPAVLIRLMDYAPKWGKPPDRIEHTGKDGKPIETVTEVRRVVVRVGDVAVDREKENPKHSVH